MITLEKNANQWMQNWAPKNHDVEIEEWEFAVFMWNCRTKESKSTSYF